MTPQEVGEGLAVIAVADDSIACFGRQIVRDTAKRSARTSNRHIGFHVESVAAASALRHSLFTEATSDPKWSDDTQSARSLRDQEVVVN